MFRIALLLVLAQLPAAPAHGSPAEGDPQPPYAVRSALERLAPQRPGQVDLYALVVAGDGAEEVFRREALAVREALDERLGTAGRSAALVNHHSQPRPEATLRTLAYALQAIARRMDVEEDVLLLHLTSHGAPRTHELLFRHPATPLYGLTPLYLRSLLDEAGVRHRVVVVSACYSGGFIAPLATGDTMVVTAASHDRPSYGCGNDSHITDFSRALYLQALKQTRSLREAARLALELVRADERAARLAPSHPQLRTGSAIDERLRILERQHAAR